MNRKEIIDEVEKYLLSKPEIIEVFKIKRSIPDMLSATLKTYNQLAVWADFSHPRLNLLFSIDSDCDFSLEIDNNDDLQDIIEILFKLYALKEELRNKFGGLSSDEEFA